MQTNKLVLLENIFLMRDKMANLNFAIQAVWLVCF